MAVISIFDIFKIGVGPSSSHTVGPMKAARAFVTSLAAVEPAAKRIDVRLHGSLAFTGRGHGTDSAVLLGLGGADPATLDPDTMEPTLRTIYESKELTVPGIGTLPFDPDTNLTFDFEKELPRHTNGMRFTAFDATGKVVLEEDWYSIGGGFVVRGDEEEVSNQQGEPPYPFTDCAGLLALANENRMSIAELVYKNECSWRSEAEIRERLDAIWSAMKSCVQRGLVTEGVLPGRMSVTRRAPKLYKSIQQREDGGGLDTMDWINAYAIAVNEENAAGGRVVTSPTNGAAGIIPAVMHYYRELVPTSTEEGIDRFLLVAGAIGILYKINASISGAEMGCQGEVGVACSMAAGGLVAALNGRNEQVENAAEIGMEHNLGLTCDPIGGLVQIPCIERNAMGALKAINAARLARHGDGTHKVSLDQVIRTMRQTGIDMSTIYKETSRGGLAVNVPEC
ncbi:MAG: L-serine ammonia-lyase [Woeseia sp.]|nr:L-serine ammonia-lyase [Woeseia sp.]MBT8095484.1 L-serine ammonia-lyase [Woeseia sp.]NNE59473.1 L-serine ammonia-lyase [Woeseia sp.]NNL55625.1 L-serine ammonia-lyase [Woeseia sp.]